jgi:hypothetical protein
MNCSDLTSFTGYLEYVNRITDEPMTTDLGVPADQIDSYPMLPATIVTYKDDRYSYNIVNRGEPGKQSSLIGFMRG